MDSEKKQQSKPHAVMFPLPFQGHVTPSIHLAMKLAAKGFTITFINTESVHRQISDSHGGDGDIFAAARGLDIRYKTVSDGLPSEANRMARMGELMERHMVGVPRHVDEIVRELVNSDTSISCLIADTFYCWAPEIAHKYSLVHISFWTQSALVFALNYHLDLLSAHAHFNSQEMCKDTITYIPGVKSIEPKDLTSSIQGNNQVEQWFLSHTFSQVKKADFILCNTIPDLESETISALQDMQPFYAIGPVVPPVTVPTGLRPAQGDCARWLNTKPEGSVLFVSFGSFLNTRECDIEEIAHGLLLSGVNFIWVIRHDAVSYEKHYTLPSELSDAVKDKGLIVPWCDQIEVISHPAIGGFLTHCGWNSVLESLWYHGVPLLCNPFRGDQITNRKLVVDDWKIGVNLCDRPSLTRVEIAEKINGLMSGKSAQELREEVIKLRQTVGNILTSETNLCRFFDDVKAKISERHT